MRTSCCNGHNCLPSQCSIRTNLYRNWTVRRAVVAKLTACIQAPTKNLTICGQRHIVGITCCYGHNCLASQCPICAYRYWNPATYRAVVAKLTACIQAPTKNLTTCGQRHIVGITCCYGHNCLASQCPICAYCYWNPAGCRAVVAKLTACIQAPTKNLTTCGQRHIVGIACCYGHNHLACQNPISINFYRNWTVRRAVVAKLTARIQAPTKNLTI